MLNYLTVLVYTNVYPPLATSTSVNNCYIINMKYCHSSVQMHLVIRKFSQMGAVYKMLNRQVEKGFSIKEWNNNSGAKRARKCGNLPIWEILVITWPYARLPARPSAPQTYQCKITQSKGIACQMQFKVILAGNRIRHFEVAPETGSWWLSKCIVGLFWGKNLPQSWPAYRAFSHDVTAAMLVFQTNPVGVEALSYVKTFFLFQ